MSRVSNPARGVDDRTQYRGRLAEDAHASLSTAVVEAIAAVRGQDPTDVDVRLYDHVHPEALDTLHRHSESQQDATWELTFAVDEFDVTVRSDGHVAVE